MLDQNTDRMWYVIGAVIVGAALIFLMNGTFPTLFANVGETFEDKVGQTAEMTDGIMPQQKGNLIDWSVHTEHYNQYPHDTTGVVTDNPSGWWNTTIGDIAVKGNATYVFSAPDGIVAPRIAFYDKQGAYISQFHLASNAEGSYFHMETKVMTPSNAAYVRLAGGDTRIDTTSKKGTSAVSDWVFKRVYE